MPDTSFSSDFNNKFIHTACNTLINIIENPVFQDDTVMAIQRKTIDFVSRYLPKYSTGSTLLTERSNLAQFATQEIPDFFDETAKQKFDQDTAALKEYWDKTFKEPTLTSISSSLATGLNLFYWWQGEFSHIFAATLLCIIWHRELYDMAITNTPPLKQWYLDDQFFEKITAMHNECFVIENIHWPKTKESIIQENKTETSDEPSLKSDTSAPNPQEPVIKKDTTISREKFKSKNIFSNKKSLGICEVEINSVNQSKQKLKTKGVPTENQNKNQPQIQIANVIKFNENYCYDPNNSEKSTAFPIQGAGKDIFYVAIDSTMKYEMNQELFNAFFDAIQYHIKFSNKGQNLKPLDWVEDSNKKQKLCYELRLLGDRFGNERLLGAPKNFDCEDKKTRCLIILNTYVPKAHQGKNLLKSIEKISRQENSFN